MGFRASASKAQPRKSVAYSRRYENRIRAVMALNEFERFLKAPCLVAWRLTKYSAEHFSITMLHVLRENLLVDDDLW